MNAANPSPDDPVPSSRKEALVAQRAAKALERAKLALEEPLSPQSGPRCPHCGRRVVSGTPSCERCGVEHGSTAAGQALIDTGSWWGELLLGSSYLPRGAIFVATHPRLWRSAVVPLLINLGIILLAAWLAGLFSDWLHELVSADELKNWTGPFWGMLSYVVWFFSKVAEALSWLVLPLLTTWLLLAFPFNLLYKLLFMPFMERLTEATELLSLKIEEPAQSGLSFFSTLVIGAVDAVVLTLLQGLLMLLLMPLNIVPGLGLALPPALFAGMDYSDIILVRHGYRTREKVTLWRVHKWRFLGYGLSFFFLLAVPFLNALVIPSAAAGGTLLYLELSRK